MSQGLQPFDKVKNGTIRESTVMTAYKLRMGSGFMRSSCFNR
jgi:hypothetical protein